MAGQTLITTIVMALGLAFAFGAAANWLRIPLLVGYLVAGVAIGPFTPGYVADQTIALQLAEVGVVLLMFGVGLHFSLHDLLSVRAVAIPGALGQMTLVSALGFGLAFVLGWSTGAGVVFGLALSVASTVVVLRALQERRLIDTELGRIVVGWLIVEDLAMVLVLVLLPAFAPLLGGKAPEIDIGWFSGYLDPYSIFGALALTVAKLAAYLLLMLVVGQRLIPYVLHSVAHTGSRELFRLAVLVLALGVAFGSAQLFGVSFALGAFVAGMVLAESTLSQQAAQETLPLRDAFAVLFFVSVGMLFDPGILVREPLPVLATFLIIVGGNASAAFLIVLAVRRSLFTALTSAASLSQIGEFSFILAGLGVALGLLPEDGRDLILAGAILSILANPLVFLALDRAQSRFGKHQKIQPGSAAQRAMPVELPVTPLKNHAVIVGCGRVGGLVASTMEARGQAFLVIEERRDIVDKLRTRGIEAILGNAAQPGLLKAANLSGARWFVSAIPNPFENGNLIEQARAANPRLEIIARAHSDDEVAHLKKLGANLIIMGEREIAHGITEHIARSLEQRPAADDPVANPAQRDAR